MITCTSTALRPHLFLALAASLLVTSSPAKDNKDLNDHPATKTVIKYLNRALARDWDAITSLIEPASLTGVHKSFVNRIKNAPTIDDEYSMVRALGKTKLKEVEAMKSGDFYAAYHRSLQKRYQLTGDKIKAISESIKLNILSVATEGDNLAHVLVRTQHEDGKHQIQNLELLSLVKHGDQWLVSLEQHRPVVTPLEKKK